MACFKLIFLFYIVSAFYFVDYVLALRMEGLYNGYPARKEKFSYQVAILIQQDGIPVHNLTCSGTIIAENLILSAAQCFINNNGDLRQFHYTIAYDTVHWKDRKDREIVIDLIYLPNGAINYVDDIAVAKLKRNLGIAENKNLSALAIPSPGESFSGQLGVVSGYGVSWVLIFQVFRSTARERINTGKSGLLNHAKVLVGSNTNCSTRSTAFHTDKQFCGVMKPRYDFIHSGTCDEDSGSPLVIDNKIVGILGTNHFDCDDTNVGSAYAKVSYYAPFINSIISGNPLPDVLVRHNRVHSLNLAAAAA